MVATEPTSLLESLGNTITEALSTFVDRISPKDKKYAPFMQPVDSNVMPLSGFMVLRLQGPTRGHFWYIRKLRIMQGTPANTVNGTLESTFSGVAPQTITVPAGSTWTPLSLAFQYSTDATAGNRTVTITFKDANGRVLYQFATAFNQAPSTANIQYSFGPGVASTVDGSPAIVTGPFPSGLSLPAGSQITISAQGLGAADTISNGTLDFIGTGIRADVFICPDDLRGIPSLAQCPMGSWKDGLSNIPQVQDYGQGELRVGPQEAVYVVVSGNPTLIGQVFTASLEAYEYSDCDEKVEWII